MNIMGNHMRNRYEGKLGKYSRQLKVNTYEYYKVFVISTHPKNNTF